MRSVNMTMVYVKWYGEHISYPADLCEYDNFVDTTWGNDMAASVLFSIGNNAYALWFCHPAIEEREDPDGQARFTLCKVNTSHTGFDPKIDDITSYDVNHSDNLFETESPYELMRFISKLEGN